ncbi:MAG TPA: AMP-binding protein [Xanthobacteraceae bacterium]|nr:AMP-binding protein [Xanthobacteraceae bacterium]
MSLSSHQNGAFSDAPQVQTLRSVLTDLVQALHGSNSSVPTILPSSKLDRDLGIDSLGRTELVMRLERAFRVRLPISVMAEANTVADLMRALEKATSQASPLQLHVVEQTPKAETLAVAPATEANTLIEALEWHVARNPDRPQVTVLQDENIVLATITYAELAGSAREVARGLIEQDILPGDRIALMLPTGADFFAAFFGTLYAGAVPVPIYPPMQLSQLEDYLRRQATILRNAETKMLVTVPDALRLGGLLRGLVPSLNALESVKNLTAGPKAASLPKIDDPTATALIQYTSGSTGDPKGVVLSHANLLANIRAIFTAIDATPAEVLMSWLPLYHDMGLIGAWLAPLYVGARCYIMSPLSFLAHPQSWLWACHRYRATISAAPNFAFELCLKQIDDADRKGLDLSSLRFVANGAEPVSIHTLRRFIERFGPYGFKASAMAPVYGLAECAVAVALPPPGREPLIDRVNREALTSRGIAEPAAADDARAIEIVACGRPLPGHEIRIVDDAGREVEERREGRLEFRGPSATSGYFHNETKTRELFRNGWLDSGDRAYIASGDVFITGRIKDIIIRAGQHIYPQELEEAIGEIDGFVKGGIAAFGVTDPASGTERIVVLGETGQADSAKRETLVTAARNAATAIIGSPPDDIVLLDPGTVPKTSSGKIRRAAAREHYLTRQFNLPSRALRRQIMRLWLAGIGGRLERLRWAAGERVYAVWWWAVLAICVAAGAVAVIAMPRRSWRWTCVRALARAALDAMRIPLAVNGIERLPKGRALLVFNHASYVDAIVLAATLPYEPAYLVKGELSGQFFAGPLLRKLGVLFVERYDLAGGIADTTAATALAQAGRLLVMFPEGTFTRQPGLLQFFTGAFKIASEAGIPVYPGVLRGTRSILRGDQWFPRRGRVDVEILDPITPRGTDFDAILRLRDAARQAVLARCGEPNLNELIKPGQTI